MMSNARQAMSDLVRRWGPALAWMAAIFVVSGIPGDEFPQYEGLWDFVVKKSGHLLEYGLLAVLLWRAVRVQRDGTAFSGGREAGTDSTRGARVQVTGVFGVRVWAALALTVLYAVTDEFHQLFIPGRGSRAVDVGIDIVGACLGLALYFALNVIRQTRSQTPRSRPTRPPT